MMHLLKISALCGSLVLAGCSSSQNGQNDPNQKPTADDPLAGSITISTASGMPLESLPEVVYDPNLSDATGGETDSGSMLGMADSAVDDGGAAGDTGGGTDGGSIGGEGTTGGSTSMPVIDDDYVEPEPRSGTLTAADYDDQLNPHLYQRYASDYLQTTGGKLDVPYLDLSKRIGLYVTDNQGRAYGGVKIDISGANGNVLNLITPANGTTYLYTDIDTLQDQFTIRATGRFGNAIDKTINLADVQSGQIDIVMPEDTAQTNGNGTTVLDVMFVVDTTGSMGDELNYIQAELTSIINAIPMDQAQVNIGLTFYRDIGDEYVVRAHGFNDDINSVQRTLNNESYAGGGDYPEAMDQALHQAIDANWQENSKRIIFLIADAPPHGNKMRTTWDAAAQARNKTIHIVPVAASGVGPDAEYLMRSMAAFTNSRYLFLTDDSGVGNPHAEPDVDCYVVTQLNNLMIRVLNSLISGVRQEPSNNEIIRRVGTYNEGVCDQVQTF